MRSFFSVIKDIFSIQELKVRIGNTLFFLFLFRIGKHIPLPGVDLAKLTPGKVKGIFSLLDTFLGGAFSSASIFALGVMPYISASIVVQLLGVIFPKFQKMQREGESGRRKIIKITRILTVLIASVQSLGLLLTTSFIKEAVVGSLPFFIFSSVIILTGGTIFCMWLGEKITDKGIGNGVSMLMMIGIVSSFPGALFVEVVHRGSRGILVLLIEMFILFMIVVFVVSFTQATRKIPIQYAKQISSGMLNSSQRQYIPFKLNSSGVMPIIFAQVFMFFIAWIVNIWRDKSMIAATIGKTLQEYTSWQYNCVFSFLIIIFSFFYTTVTINPNQIADDMKRNNSFVPGIKSGYATAVFFDDILYKITLIGSLLLAAISFLPTFAHIAGVSDAFSKFYGGTSLLIMVGVVLETLQQIESYLLMRHYEGIITGRRMKDRLSLND